MRSPCVVCGMSDERGLTFAALGRERVSVCGTHHLMYVRSGARLTSVEELRALVRERRNRRERRRALADEMVAQLADAFSTEKRTGTERRS